MGLGNGAQHPFHSGRDARLVRGALEDRRLDVGVGDALSDVTHEHVDHHLGPLEDRARAAEVEVVRHVVVRVEPGRGDDVDVDLLVDLLDPRDVAPEPDDGEVDDGVDALRLEVSEASDGVVDALLLVPALRIVGHDLGAQDEHMLVHEHAAEARGVDGTANGLDGGHGRCPLSRRSV